MPPLFLCLGVNTPVILHVVMLQKARNRREQMVMKMNLFKTLPLLAALIVGGLVLVDAPEANAQQIIHSANSGGKRTHKRAAKKSTTSTSRTTTTTRGGSTTHTVTRQRTTGHHNPHVKSRHIDRRHNVVEYRNYRHNPYVHPRYHYSYRYVYWPRYHHVEYVDRTNIVYVETEPDPSVPELECPIRTDSISTQTETYCATDRGTRHGPFVRYHSNGEVAEEGLYEYGTKEGIWVQYHSNGVLKSEGNYHNGERVGEWTNFNLEGEETNRTIYR